MFCFVFLADLSICLTGPGQSAEALWFRATGSGRQAGQAVVLRIPNATCVRQQFAQGGSVPLLESTLAGQTPVVQRLPTCQSSGAVLFCLAFVDGFLMLSPSASRKTIPCPLLNGFNLQEWGPSMVPEIPSPPPIMFGVLAAVGTRKNQEGCELAR